MTDRTITSAERSVSFGPFRLLPAQQLLLEGEAPVRLGSRALEILIALVERAGELVSKGELMARVWPDTFVDEGSIKVHVAGLRRALGDGQPGRRYVANVPGRGYRFVAPLEMSEPERPSPQNKPTTARAHNLPISQSRAVGRAEVIGLLLDRLPKQRFITIVGAGGIGKTTVALALAEALLPAYEDGVRFVDLAPVDDQQFVPNALGTTLGLAIHSKNAISLLVDFLRDKKMLIVLDSCEHVAEAAADLAEQLLSGTSGVHILATSREPLRAEGERIHRMAPLESPRNSSDLTAAEALAFPAVRLFVERTAAILDGFELSDADAPIVSDICRKLGGIALAIELAAARVDAFSIPQLSVLLNDRFHILKKGKRTAQPRHQSLAAALDWSYEFLTEVERIVLRRLSVFAGTFTLGSVVAVAGDDITDVVEAVANLVAKSLISADVGGVAVQYRLLETTRAYAMQKLIEMGEFEGYARRHAEHYLEWFKRGEDDWWTLSAPEWLEDYGRRIDDVRNALNWAFSPNGDALIGVALTIASIQSWLVLSLMHECRERIERALASLAAQPTHSEREEMSLLTSLGLAQLYTEGPQAKNDGAWAKALQLAEKLDDIEYQVRALWGGAVWRFYVGEYREALAYAKKCCVVAAERGNATLELIGDDVAGAILFYLGNYTDARHHLDRAVSYHLAAGDSESVGHRASSRITLSNILWIQGFPDQAVCSVQVIVDEAQAVSNAILLCNTLAQAACPISLYVGDLAGTERSVAMLLEYSAKHALSTWSAVGRCWKGALLLAQGDRAGLAVLRTALDGLRGARVAVLYTMSLGTLAHGLGAAGQFVEAHQAIDEALERTERNEERWCMAELLRIKGEILRLDGSADADQAAEDCFQQSLDWARRQEALSWELRAATSLAKLWRQNGKRAEANELLSYVYNRFTEGFDTVDLRTARALIDEFHKGQS